MEPQVSNKEDVESETALEKSTGQSSASSPNRGRGEGCFHTDLTLLPETNGAASGSGRVLRDRSTRTVPGWRQSDISLEPAEVSREGSGNRRRKAKCPRRRKSAAAVSGSSDAGREISSDCDLLDEFGESNDELGNRAARGRRVQMRSGARTCRGSPGTVFKIEPEMDNDYAEANKSAEKTGTRAEKEEDDDAIDEDDVMEEEESPFVDDPKDENYVPQSVSEGEEVVSTDEDVPFKDDLNDQSYTPKDSPVKSKRRPHTRLKEKKEKAVGKESRTEPEHETEIKTEGEENADVQTATRAEEDPVVPRKRGRRRKDDKTPRIPKRRKKPPVQYVRCEMEGCGTVLAHPRYLQHHIKYQHLMKKKYVCPHPTCGRLFRLQKQLLRHAKHHTDQRDYICEFCARAFKSSHNLAVHRMIHTGEKPLHLKSAALLFFAPSSELDFPKVLLEPEEQSKGFVWFALEHFLELHVLSLLLLEPDDRGVTGLEQGPFTASGAEGDGGGVRGLVESPLKRMIWKGDLFFSYWINQLACEICGFTCRQKASLNWHMKKHDADATYQFSCNICGKKFEKKDSVVAHKAKSHPEVLIAEALAANAGGLITTPAGISTLLETSPSSQQADKVLPKPQGSSSVPSLIDPDQSGRSMQVPVSLTMPSNEENKPSVQQSSSHPLQMPLQFPSLPAPQQLQKIQPLPLQPPSSAGVSNVVQQMPLQPYSHQSPIVHMNYRGPPQQQQQLPLGPIGQSHPNQTLSRPQSHNLMTNTSMLSQMLPEASADRQIGLGFQRDHVSSSMPSQSSSMPSESRQVIWERSGTEENGNVGRNWEANERGRSET
ncbi:hypothetical protein DNTS_034086 [Danionella cerebrum]|uniref:E3 ubiquitin-protein ligase ZFP91 n=1 Tax=Danionella cerebrum TaxID=2873325 RepID=A0A553RFA2_9TELE|nr:hypothetical protein DNTS_034086 [Danionella translucida]